MDELVIYYYSIFGHFLTNEVVSKLVFQKLSTHETIRIIRLIIPTPKYHTLLAIAILEYVANLSMWKC